MTPTERATVNRRASELYEVHKDRVAVAEILIKEGVSEQAAQHAARRAEALERMIAATK